MPIDSTTYLQLPIINNYGKVDVFIHRLRLKLSNARSQALFQTSEKIV